MRYLRFLLLGLLALVALAGAKGPGVLAVPDAGTGLLASGDSTAAGASTGSVEVPPEVLAALSERPRVGVIVGLREPPALRVRPFNLPAIRSEVDTVQQRVLAELPTPDFSVTYRYRTIPALAGQATLAGVVKLIGNPNVTEIVLDEPSPLALAESVPLINADHVHDRGLTGYGVVAAVLDSGIDTDHPDLASSIAGEECFLTGAVAAGGNPCPGGGPTQSGPGAAEDDDGHGTAVAGIITGDGAAAPIAVAPGASILAYKVCSTDVPPPSGENDTRCFPQDWLAALDHIFENHPEVRAINMSFASGAYWIHCDYSFQLEADRIAALRAQGALTFAASGNSGDKYGIGRPACFSTAVSVGEVYDDDFGLAECMGVCCDIPAPVDQVVCESQSAPILDLLAPGYRIDTAGLGGGVTSAHGTSLAAPHAAGVAALLWQKHPFLTAEKVEDCLKTTGAPVTDPGNGVTAPRVDATLTLLSCPDLGTSPSGIPLNSNAPSDSSDDWYPQVATDGAGNWLTVWGTADDLGGTIGTDADILMSRSYNNGATWTDPSPLNANAASDSASDGSAQVATDGAGNLVAVWWSAYDLGPTGEDFDILVASSNDHGATWTAPQPLNPYANTDSQWDVDPQVATDGAGNWVAIWVSEHNLGGSIGTDRDILVARSGDNGATWTAPIPLNTNAPTDSGGDNSPAMATDGVGNWVVVWHSYDDLGGTIGPDGDILIARSDDNGSTWTAPIPLNTNAAADPEGSPFGDQFPEISTDDAGNWVAVWRSNQGPGAIGTDFDILVASSSDNGATWSSPQPLNANAATDSGGDVDPKVATDRMGTWVAAWLSSDDLGGTIETDTDILVARSNDDGASWTAPAALIGNAAMDSAWEFTVEIAADGAGNWVAVWESPDSLGDAVGEDWDILYVNCLTLLDGDCDTVPDDGDNCPDTHNLGQEDAEGDGVGDSCDNCPAWSNSDQSLPPWPVPADDPDCDGFTDAEEAFVGTDPADNCPDNVDDDAWPADLVHTTLGYGKHDGKVNILDIIRLAPPVFGKSPPDPNYSERKDFNGDGTINILDIIRLAPPTFGKSCTP